MKSSPIANSLARSGPPLAGADEDPSRWKPWVMPAFILTCWALAIRHLAPDWTLNEQYHYGWLVPLLALYLIKVRFEKCPAPGPMPSKSRIHWLVFVAAFASVLSMPLREANIQWRSMGWWLSALAAVVTLAGFWQVGGSRWLRHFIGPVLFFFTAVPLWRQLEEGGMHWLMQHNARLSAETLHWFGIEVQARGNLIADHVPQMVGHRMVGWAYSIGYIKALYASAKAEAGKA